MIPGMSYPDSASSVGMAEDRKKSEKASAKEADGPVVLKDQFHSLIEERMEEFKERLKNGGTEEPSYQIGASAYTEKEWDKLLSGFDAAQRTIREAMRQEHKKRAEASEREEERRDEDEEKLRILEAAGLAVVVKTVEQKERLGELQNASRVGLDGKIPDEDVLPDSAVEALLTDIAALEVGIRRKEQEELFE